MIDIVSNDTGLDMGIADTQVPRATNILSVQLDSLEYAPEGFGIDLNYFLSPDFSFQTDSFKAYTIRVLANNGINVASLIETKQRLFSDFVYNLAAAQETTGLISR